MHCIHSNNESLIVASSNVCPMVKKKPVDREIRLGTIDIA